MMNVDVEVLMYMQLIRKYFSINEDAKKYFGINENDENFYETIFEISKKNYLEKNDPKLTIEQFEELRMKFLNKTIEEVKYENYIEKIKLEKFPELKFVHLN